MNWKIAAEMLGIQDSIQLEIGAWPADLSCFPDGYYRREGELHMIGVCGGLSPEKFSQTLWHELTHALQCEREFGGDGRVYHSVVSGVAEEVECGERDHDPWEDEAEKAEKLDRLYRLVTD